MEVRGICLRVTGAWDAFGVPADSSLNHHGLKTLQAMSRNCRPEIALKKQPGSLDLSSCIYESPVSDADVPAMEGKIGWRGEFGGGGELHHSVWLAATSM